ncbi:MAG: translation initiation factor [Armatimonadetes bacterium]|nr:translation initiation factor [Armatimonadota bacterium]
MGKSTLKMRLERSGRHGKAVTVLFELGLDPRGQKELLRELQRACGTGGTAKDGRIEIQGDHRDQIHAVLTARGIKIKRAGG